MNTVAVVGEIGVSERVNLYLRGVRWRILKANARYSSTWVTEPNVATAWKWLLGILSRITIESKKEAKH